MHVEMLLVFVYGTLKLNQPNYHKLLDNANGEANLVKNGITNDKYPLVIGTRYNIPFLVDLPDVGHNVKGEIYAVDEKMLATLDEFEGHPHYYLRKEITVNAEGKKYVCWAYLLTKYPDDFLQDRQLLENYEDSDEYRYVPPGQRPPDGPKPSEDLDYRP